MAVVEKAIHDLLTAATAVAALVSSRVYPLRAPDGVAAPFIVYQRISGVRWRTLSGACGIAQPRIQIDVYAATYAGAKALASAVRVALDGYRGIVAGVRIGGITLETDQDLLEDDIDPVLHRVTMDFMVTHDE